MDYVYDLNSRMTSSDDPESNTSAYVYNSRNELQQMTYADSTTAKWRYDDVGNLLYHEDQAGNEFDYVYDEERNLLREVDVTLATGFVGNEQLNFDYDGLGRMTMAAAWEDSGGLVEVHKADLAYNTYSLPDSSTEGLGLYYYGGNPTDIPPRTITHDYNGVGMLTDRTFSNSSSLSFTYDEAYRVTSMDDPLVTVGGDSTWNYEYLGGMLTKNTFPGFGDFETVITYNDDLLVESMVTQGTSGNLVGEFDFVGFDYSYNEVNNLIGELPADDERGRCKFADLIAAFANSGGGSVIYGVEEGVDTDGKQTGRPARIVGVADAFDHACQRLNALIQSRITPQPLVEFYSVEVQPHPVIVVTVRQSWTTPHVSSANRDRFPVRSHASVRSLDWHEIKAAFLASEGVKDKIERFRNDRIMRSITNPPAVYRGDNRLLLHLYPLAAADARDVDLQSAHADYARLAVGSQWTVLSRRFNLDGLLVYCGAGDDTLAHVQLFRNGVIELCSTTHQTTREREGVAITRYHATRAEQELLSVLPAYASVLRDHGVDPPFVVMLSLVGLSGARLQQGDMAGDRDPVATSDQIVCPDLVWDGDLSPGRLMKPVFDLIWNAFGYPLCLNFDGEGNYIAHT